MISGTRYRMTVEINRQAKLASEMVRAQTEISTGKKILAPSDDPTGAARVAEIARAEGNESTWLRNLDAAASLADRSDTALTSLAAIYDRAKELMLRAASATLPADGRATIAMEIRGAAEDAAIVRDSRDPRGEPLFRINHALEIPVSEGVTLAPVAERAAIFDGVGTPDGPADLIAILTRAADAAVEPDLATRATAIRNALDALDAGLERIAAARGEQGVRGNRIDTLRERLLGSGLEFKELRTSLEGADIPEAVARFESKKLMLEAAQAVFARVNRNTLFDLLR